MMVNKIDILEIIDIINSSNRIGIFTHSSPDGDAIGSSLGLYLGLKQLNKDVDVIVDKYSACFDFLPGIDCVKSESDDKYDLAIVVDCASKRLLFDTKGGFDNSNITLAIDHHVSNTCFSMFNYIEGDSPAVCKTLINILKKLGVSINVDIGTCLMAGIITDSGGFRYDKVNDETFEIAADMFRLGVNISDIYYRTFDLKTRAQFELTTIACSRLRFYSDDRIVVTYINQDDLKKANALTGDHEGIVNIGRNISGVEVSILLREEVTGIYKVSLRSKNDIKVSEVASLFGGGGHDKAAGCMFECHLEEAIENLVKEVTKRL